MINMSTQRGQRRIRHGWCRLVAGAVAAALGLAGLAASPADASTFRGSANGVAVTDGSMYRVVDQIGARSLWQQGVTGRGVSVAVIDTGVVPVPALTGADKVVAMVDLSGEAAVPAARYLDTYGHGTHIAGIIAGRDPGASPARAAQNPQWFLGVAPDASIVSVKVGNNTGAVDVTQVIAGIDWVIENAATLRIRVLTLAYGSGSLLGSGDDPLSFAVERAWKAGIVVVVAAGNDGRSAQLLDMPARNPYVIAVAAARAESNGRFSVPNWATTGDGVRNPDVSAPGASIQSLRDPGSRIDAENPAAAVGQYLFKGSGSSQAAAVVSGVAALLLSARPELTPDQVKHLVRSTADAGIITPSSQRVSGQGLVRVAAAAAAATTPAVQTWPAATGTGSIDAARGGYYVTVNDQPVQGEITVLGTPWTGASWTGPRWSGGSLSKGVVSGAAWMGVTWADAYWTGAPWVGRKWAGVVAPSLPAGWAQTAGETVFGSTWGGVRWGDVAWDGVRWGGVRWGSDTWAGVRWGGVRWGSDTWAGVRWGGSAWN